MKHCVKFYCNNVYPQEPNMPRVALEKQDPFEKLRRWIEANPALMNVHMDKNGKLQMTYVVQHHKTFIDMEYAFELDSAAKIEIQ